MAAANWFRYLHLAHLSRPKSARPLYRLVKRRQVCRIVEVGISDVARSHALIEVAQRYAGQQTVRYTGIDWFDARPPELPPLSLKQAYRLLRATGASARLMPGATLADAANSHLNTDLILIAHHVADDELQRAWFYVPRMLREGSLILREQRDSQLQPVFAQISTAQVAEWARRQTAHRVA